MGFYYLYLTLDGQGYDCKCDFISNTKYNFILTSPIQFSKTEKRIVLERKSCLDDFLSWRCVSHRLVNSGGQETGNRHY